ncbi:MAG: DUF4293 domain-containing protein [Candidatus Competibacteraceae bacterium]|nr:DUF4293 domain-containing protein [Candidatus Competibacteraceae bacterium]
MLQRIQSIYFLMAIISVLLMAFLPIFSIELPGLQHRVFAFTQQIDKVDMPSEILMAPLLILIPVGLSILFTTFVTFSFKHRKKQAKLCLGLMIFQLLIIVLSITWLLSTYPTISISQMTTQAHPLSLIFPIVSIVWIFMARKAILKDEELVRSVDRIR